MQAPFLCVIIPAYNCEKYLEVCVHSVLSQPFQNIKIVIVNDGSTDHSLQVAQELARSDPRIYVIDQKNQGVSVARNAGIEYSIQIQSKFTAFLDSDDAWCPNCVNETIVSTMLDQPQVQIWGFDSVCSNYLMDRFRTTKNLPYKTLPGPESLWNFNVHFGSMLYSTDLLKEYNVRFYVNLKYSEDQVFKLKCLCFSSLASKIPNVYMYIYRSTPHSAMSKVRSFAPISYYTPIINAWVSAGADVNTHRSENPKLQFGDVLAGIYLLDMATDHFKQWRSRKTLRSAQAQNPHFHLLSRLSEKDISKVQYKNRCLLLEHPLVFEFKYRALGLVEFIAVPMLRIPVVRRLLDRKKYPLAELPKNT